MHPDNMPQGCSITSTTTTSSGDHLQGPRNVRITSISLLFHTLQVRERLFCSSGPTHTVASQVMESFYMCFHPLTNQMCAKGIYKPLTILGSALAPPCSEEDICWQLSQCKSGKAPGPDGIQAQMLTLCAVELLSVQWSFFL